MTQRFTAIDRLRLAVKAVWRPQTLKDLDAELDAAFGGQPTFAGVNVSENTALNYMALYACVLVRAKAIGTLSLHLYQRQEKGGARRATEHRLYGLVHDAPNEEVTSVGWRAAKSAHIDTWGNGYTWIDRATLGRNAGQVTRLLTLKPDKVKPYRDSSGRLKYEYKVRKADGTEDPRTYDMSQVLHIPGLGYDGLMGYSPVSLQRQAIGLGMGIEEFEARFLGQGTHPSGLLVPKVAMREQEYQTWKKAVIEQYSGLGKTGSLMALSGDASYTAMTMPLKDAEFLGLRQFQLGEMARLYRVPLVLLQDHEKTTTWGTGVEHIMISFVTFTIMPEAREWEQRMNLRLLTERERADGYYFEHDFNSLLRGDAVSRGAFYKVMRETSMANANELRAFENMNPRKDPGGELYWDEGPSGQGGQSNAQAAMRPVLIDAAARIMAREQRDILAEAEKWTKRDDMDGFTGWLGGYWSKHKAFCVEALTPGFTGLGQPEMAHRVAQQHVETLQSALKVAQTGGVDAIRECLETRVPSDMHGIEEVSAR